MLGTATGSIMRLPKVFRATSARTGTVRISTRQLETLLDQIESVNQRVGDLVAGHSVADLTTSLEPSSWSVAQCLDHLAQTTGCIPSRNICCDCPRSAPEDKPRT